MSNVPSKKIRHAKKMDKNVKRKKLLIVLKEINGKAIGNDYKKVEKKIILTIKIVN
jgi:hypothetical protein